MMKSCQIQVFILIILNIYIEQGGIGLVGNTFGG